MLGELAFNFLKLIVLLDMPINLAVLVELANVLISLLAVITPNR